MSQAIQPLLPPIDAVVEKEDIIFDFGSVLQPATHIASITSVSCSVARISQGADSQAATRAIGSPSIIDAPESPDGSGVADGAVKQTFGTMLGGVTYLLQCVVVTSDGQTLSLYGYLACSSPA